MNTIFDDSALIARRVVADVFNELSQITVADGFNTDLGLSPIILESAGERAKAQSKSLIAVLDGTHSMSDFVSVPLVVGIPLNGKTPRVMLNDVIQDISRVLEGLRMRGYAQKFRVIASTYSRTPDNLVGLLRLRVSVTQKGATK